MTDTLSFEKLPSPWFVWEMGQDPVHMLWWGAFINFENTEQVIQLEEYDNPKELIDAAKRQIASKFL